MTRLLVVDATPYGPGPSGAKRRAVEILPRLARLLPSDVFEVHWARDGGGPPPGLEVDNLVHVTVDVPSGGGALRWLARARDLARRHRDAPFTHLLTDHGPVVRPTKVRNIVTVHDLRFRHGYGGWVRRWYGRTRYGRMLSRATTVVAVSVAVRDELVDAYRLDQVVVARNAAAPPFVRHAPYETATLLARLGVAGPYALLVARDEPRKALGAGVAAWREAAKSSGLGLVVAGAPGWREPGVLSVGEVADAELVDLYSGARWTLSPSLYEGYALTVAESLACGTPVLASDIPAHRAFVDEGARGVVLAGLPRRGKGWSWPEGARALLAEPPHPVTGPASTWDAAAATLARSL